MKLWIIAANVVGCAVLQLGLARAFVLLPSRWFERNGFWSRQRWGEFFIYRRGLRVTAWKRSLPDGAVWVGSAFAKRRPPRDVEHLRRFVTETRRGEAAHWAMIVFMPCMFAWNPPWARVALMAYAVVANAPCIVVQRYNRIVLTRILGRL